MITAFYAALLGLLFIFLSVQVIRQRRASRVSIGDGENPALARAIRAHGNFAEYTPLTLLLIFMLESMINEGWWIHILCLALLLGRAVHAYGLSQVKEDFRFRVTGMMLSFTSLALSCVTIILAKLLG